MSSSKSPGACKGQARRAARAGFVIQPALLALVIWALAPGPVSAASDPTSSPPASTEASASNMAPAPTRAVTLAPHITELVFAAGAGGRIVGTVASSDHPPEARAIHRVGDGLLINAESLLARRPDVVLAWAPSQTLRALAPTLSASGVAMQYSQPRVLDDIPEEVQRFGRLFGTTAIATPQAETLRQRIAALRQRYASSAPVSVFLDLGETPLYTLGDDPMFNSVLAACGGVNLYADAGVPAPQVSAESVLARQPDVVLVAAPEQGRARPTPWQSLKLPAALHGRMHYVDPDTLLRPGPRLIDAAERVCGHLEAARQPMR